MLIMFHDLYFVIRSTEAVMVMMVQTRTNEGEYEWIWIKMNAVLCGETLVSLKCVRIQIVACWPPPQEKYVA